MADLSKLSAAKLEAAYDKRFAANSAVTRACIDGGLGNWRPSDRDAAIRGERGASEDQLRLCAQWRDAADAFFAVVAEMEERKRWHGSLKPIRRAA